MAAATEINMTKASEPAQHVPKSGGDECPGPWPETPDYGQSPPEDPEAARRCLH